MLFSGLARHGASLALALILGLALAGSLSVPVQAQDPVDLVLGGEGSTSWDIGNIKPGDSGTKAVTLHNAGNKGGSVTIWISDIVSSEGTNPESETGDTAEPGELADYLLLDISCGRLSTNLGLPATIDNLPQSASDPNYVKVSPLNAGDTVDLDWEWQLPPEVGNDVQGDGLSFTINYMLEELPSGGGATGGDSGYGGYGGSGGGDGYEPSLESLELDITGEVTQALASASDGLLDSLAITDTDKSIELEFRRGTKITSANGEVISRLEIRVCQGPRLPPDDLEIIGTAYDIIGYVGDKIASSVIFSKPAELTLSYDPVWLPENTSSIFIGWCDNGHDWSALGPAVAGGSAAELGEVNAFTRHASTFAILARLVPVEPAPVEPVPVEPAPVEPAGGTTVPPATGGEEITRVQDVPGKQPVVPVANDGGEPVRQASLAAAVAGVTAMTTLAFIERRRRGDHDVKPA